MTEHALTSDNGHAPGLHSSRKPRYMQIAKTLREEIRHGAHPVGAQMPTEAALCKRFGISRFTTRAALRLLEDMGLVSRRRGSGTTVRSFEAKVQYSQVIRTADEVMQYVRATPIQFLYTDRVHADSRIASWLNVREGVECVHLHAIRHDRRTKEPYCIAELYRRANWYGLPIGFTRVEDAVRELVDHQFQQRIGKVEQTLSAVGLSEEDAQELHVAANTPGFRSVRRYFDLKGHLLLVAVALHPGHMFSYHTSYERRDMTIGI